MPKLTALGQEVASESSALPFVPNAPNICLTPAAPSPVPIPYPIMGDSGSLDSGCETVLHGDKPTMNTHSKVAAIQGNEAGTGGDIVTGVTTGTAWALTGASTVLFEGAEAVTANSPGFGNCV